MTKLTSIIDELIKHDDAYYNGESIISDYEYDDLKKDAYKLFPGHSYFMQVGATIRGDKERLPFQMGSLNQKHDDNELKDWISKYALNNENLTLSDKLDGVSCMIQYKDGKLMKAYSRGDGINGQDITRHVLCVNNLPKTINVEGYMTIRGELIMNTDKFIQSWQDEFRNPRNMVSGIIYRKESYIEALEDISFVAYQIVNASVNISTSSHCEDMSTLFKYGFETVHYTVHTGKELNESFLTKYIKQIQADSCYELDGVVITIDDKDNHKKLSNSQSLNPEHAIKFKVLAEDSLREATVADVEYNISMNGYYKPRIRIHPVDIMGVTVTYLTGYNAKYIVDNNINMGSKLLITRSGAVIPICLKVLEPSNEPKYPDEPWEWNKTQVDMKVYDLDNHPLVIFQQVVNYFTTLDVEGLKEGILRKVMTHYDLVGSSYTTVIKTLHALLEPEWTKAVGANGSKVYASLKRKEKAMHPEVFLGALKYMGFGFGVRKAKLLLKGVSTLDEVWHLTSKDISNIEGFNETSDNVANGLKEAYDLYQALDITFIVEEKTNEMNGMVIVFTGFRDKELQNRLELQGAKVTTSVSKNTTLVVTGDENSSSGKVKKAREFNIPVMGIETFKDNYNL